MPFAEFVATQDRGQCRSCGQPADVWGIFERHEPSSWEAPSCLRRFRVAVRTQDAVPTATWSELAGSWKPHRTGPRRLP